MEPLAVVDLLDEVGDRALCFCAVAVMAGSTSSHFRVFMKLSALALSYGLPERLMLIRNPFNSSRPT